MIPLSPSLKASLESDVSTLCRIVTITLKNGTILRYTSLDRSVTVGDDVYIAVGIDPSAVRQSSIGGGDGGSLTLQLGDDSAITEAMIRSRALAGAKYVLEIIDYQHPEYGTMVLGAGLCGTVTFNERGECDIDLNGLLSSGVKSIGEVYSQNCRNDFGDANCQYDVESLRVPFVIDSVLDYQSFQANELVAGEDAAWDLGVVTFTSGDNGNISIEVSASDADGTIELALPPAYEMQPGDEATITPGCSKQRSACRAYDNVLNFRGEPDVPSIDQMQAPVAIDTSSTPPPTGGDVSAKTPIYARNVGA